MRAAAGIGRVGGLAVAMGVGIAAAGAGIAWADDTATEPSVPATAPPAAPASTPSPVAQPSRSVERPASLPASRPSAGAGDSGRAALHLAPPTPVRHRGVGRAPAEPPAPAVKTTASASARVPAPQPVAAVRNADTRLPAPPEPAAATPAAALTALPVVAPVLAAAPNTASTVPVAAPRMSGVLSGLLAAFGIGPLAGSPVAPAEPPLLWSLFAWARKEFERLASGSALTSVASAPVAAAPMLAAAVVSGPVTTPVAWVTGSGTMGPYFLPRTNNTSALFGIAGTDLGIMWDNGIADNLATAVNEHQILMAFGDTFSGTGMTGTWRSNTLLRTSDGTPADGLTVAPGVLGDIFSGSPLSAPNFSKQIIKSSGYLGWFGSEVTIIPTSGISVPYDNAYGSRQYVSFMSVKSWDTPGRWTTNYAGIAYSDDNGQNWTVASKSIRSAANFRTNTGYVSGNQNFQQSAFVRPPDGAADSNYVYMFGTPSGRGGTVYLSRVAQADVADQTKYQYWNGSTWVANSPSAAKPILPVTSTATTGFLGWFLSLFGISSTTYPSAGELSVQYNTYLNKYVMMYADSTNNIVMRTADQPQGTWSAPVTLTTSIQYPGLYAPMMDPWTTGQDIYWNMSMWGDYNVLLMHTRLV